ncbi:hypothetical protein [Rummeliibacillus pycnus]|uniref:hypothetical protein n=1 Tax=Rummeliibacillus pycnus TaxID=101070 RepID=UPI001FE777FF|nr:hypothetical protein [Rummeliibacillus pycnus]
MIDIQQKIKAKGKKNVQQAGIKERYFIIVDEVGELNPSEAVTSDEKKLKQECQRIMLQISRIGAGLGFRLIVASQYPTGDVIPRQVKQNSDAKLSFRFQSQIASRVVLDEAGAELLPQIRGRAIYQAADKREIFQTPMITSNNIEETIKPHIRVIEQEEVHDAIEIETVISKARIDTVTFEEV